MKRILKFNYPIIDGYDKRDLVRLFPELNNSFNKESNGYSYTETTIKLTIEKIQGINDKFFSFILTPYDIIINE